MRGLRFGAAALSLGSVLAFTLIVVSDVNAQTGWRFHLEEATIADIHRAIRAKQITASQIVTLYLKRIEAYNGTCVKGDVDPVTCMMFGEITPIENAGQVHAYITLNIRGKRSKTDKADKDPKLPDALEVARAQDRHFARTGRLVGPLHGVPVAIKDNFDTVDMRTTAGAAADYANDRPPQDATMVAKLRAAGAIIIGKANLDEYAPAGIGRSSEGGQTCNPHGSRLEGPKPDQIPVGMEFLTRPFEEALLFEIASAYEHGAKHRRPPTGFGPLAGEP